jgi:hypothetical protein
VQKKYLITQIFLLYAKHILKCISAAITRICVVRYVRFYTRWHRRENDQFSTLRCTKTGSTQPKLSAACFVVQSCLADADFVVFSNYCLIGTRQNAMLFCSQRICLTASRGSWQPYRRGRAGNTAWRGEHNRCARSRPSR